MRVVIIGLVLGLMGCATPPTSGAAPAAIGAPSGAQQAYFEDFPDDLVLFFASSCDRAADKLVPFEAADGEIGIRCESLPTPEAAAAIILRFEGSVEDIPTIVRTLSARQTPPGVTVTVDTYFRVPRRDGGTQIVRFPTAPFQDTVIELLEAAGGRPL